MDFGLLKNTFKPILFHFNFDNSEIFKPELLLWEYCFTSFRNHKKCGVKCGLSYLKTPFLRHINISKKISQPV